MIWENKVHCVVMTTNTVEKGRDKCAVYWPQTVTPPGTGGVTVGNIRVKCLHKKRDRGYERSYLEVTCGNESRKVEHFWYNTWPVTTPPIHFVFR